MKNKVAPPFQVAEFDIMYNEGISREGDLVDTGAKYEVLKKSGSWYQFEEEKIGQGREAAKKYLRKNPKIANQIFKLIKQRIKEEEQEEK